jgi:uncharacterized protein (TIGR03435 family)
MTHRENNDRDFVERLLGLFNSPPSEEMEQARQRILRRLRSESVHPIQESLTVESKTLPSKWRWQAVALTVAAAAVVLGLFVGIPAIRNSNRAIDVHAVVESADGGLFRVSGGQPLQTGEKIEAGDIVRTDGGDGTALALADGSRVEMRAQTALSLEHAGDGVRIRLDNGGVIVTAAKQRNGHLYVQTKDVNVSVVGTVFLVNAEETGSRVAVIQGAVQVQQGSTSKKLLPGEQLATNPSMVSVPVSKEISWSRQAEAHLALLERATAEAAQRQTRQVPLEFAAVSIRPFGANTSGSTVGSRPLGFACRAADGTLRTSYFGGELTVVAPQGRCVGDGLRLSDLIAVAYNLPVRYGPEVSASIVGGELHIGPGTMLQVEAVAENAATVTTDEMKQMIQTMLSDRFNLKFHREMQEIPGYVLLVAKNGPKLKIVSGNDEVLTRGNSPGQPVIGGRSKMDGIVRWISAFINPTGVITDGLPSYVVDKTGLLELYEYEFYLPLPGGGQRGNGPAQGQAAGPPSAAQVFAWRAPAMSAALEEQLGLRLQAEKVRTEVIVVDHADKPSPN